VTAQPSGVLTLVGQAMVLKKIVEDKIAKDDVKIEPASNMNIAPTTYVSISRPTIYTCAHPGSLFAALCI
jgi:hypothetical protein